MCSFQNCCRAGGAGSCAHVIDVLEEAGADAALLAGVLHDGTLAIPDLKRALAQAGVAIRSAS